jgi:hypothetical protein
MYQILVVGSSTTATQFPPNKKASVSSEALTALNPQFKSLFNL